MIESNTIKKEMEENWTRVCQIDNFPFDGGAAVKCGERQIAVFHFAARNEWYAVDNMCPHKKDMVLARGLTGDKKKEPIVACPHHKKVFSLWSGQCLTDSALKIKLYPIKIKDDGIFINIAAGSPGSA